MKKKNESTKKTKKTTTKKAVPVKKIKTAKVVNVEPETHTLKNLIILWICLFAAGMLGILLYGFMINYSSKNTEKTSEIVEEKIIIEEVD